MKCAILSIGNEVVEGHVINSNATYFARRLNEVGFEVLKVLSIIDDEQEIAEAISYLKYDLVIISGGLGPTADDKTKECLAKTLARPLVLNNNIKNELVKYFEQRGYKYDTINDKQALFSQGDIILNNDRGTADGYYFKHGATMYCVLPGPPYENKPIFENFLTIFEQQAQYEKNIFIYGIGESLSEVLVKDIYLKYPDIYIGSYLQDLGIIYRLNGSDLDLLNHCAKEVKTALESYYLCDYEDPIGYLVDKLIDNNLRISFAESCTGGLASATIINYSNASKVINESFVTYANEAKIKYLNVDPNILVKHGAVSSACAISMVKGLVCQTNSNVGIAITGLAGPNGGSEEKPVGLVYFAISLNGEIYEYKQVFNGERNLIRRRAVNYILFELLRLLDV